MKKFIYTILLLISAALAFSVSAYAEFDDGSVIAVVKSAAEGTFSLASFDAPFGDLEIEEAENLDTAVKGDFSLFSLENEPQTYKLTLAEKGEDAVLAAVDYLNSLDTIEYAQPNYIYTLAYTPDDPYYYYQYGLETVGAPDMWNLDIDCSGVTVAIIDSGAYLDHEDLESNLWDNPKEASDSKDNDSNGYKDDFFGWDFVDNDNTPYDTLGHGTHVAGIISALTGNGKGVASLARNAKLMILRVTDGSTGSTDRLYKAIVYARVKGADIVNMSLTSKSSDSLVKNEINKTNALFVCAAGNDGTDNDTKPYYPASYTYSKILSVASTTSTDSLSSFSNYGVTSVDLAAPGTRIYSTYYTGGYEYMSGTSMACPMAASAAAVVKAAYPSYTPAQIASKLISSVDKLSALSGKVKSGGRLNIYNAVKALATPAPSPTPTPTPTPTPSPTPTPIPYVEVTGEIKFEPNDDDTVEATLAFDEGSGPDYTELRAYAAYRSGEGNLLAVVPLAVKEDMTVTIDTHKYSDCNITLYIWDKYMRPRMIAQTYKASDVLTE